MHIGPVVEGRGWGLKRIMKDIQLYQTGYPKLVLALRLVRNKIFSIAAILREV